MTSYSRKQYLSGEVTHLEYYGQFAESIEQAVVNTIGRERILASTDPHMNDIPLQRWDSLQGIVMNLAGRAIGEANGISFSASLSDCVCAAKAAAILYRKREKADD